MELNETLHVVIKKVETDLSDRPIPARVEFVSRLAREAAQESARLSGLALDGFPKNPQGVPLPSGEVYWSLTHKQAYVGGVTSLNHVGVDLEFKRPIAMKIFDRVATNKEWQLAINAGLDSRTAFFMVWTAKEAVLKRLGVLQGFYKGLSDCVLEEVDMTVKQTVFSCNRKTYRVRYYDFDGHLAALCSDAANIEWHLQDCL